MNPLRRLAAACSLPTLLQRGGLLATLVLLTGTLPAQAFDLIRAGATVGTPTIGGTLGSQFTRLAGFNGSLEATGPVKGLNLRANAHYQPLTVTQSSTLGFGIIDFSVQAQLDSQAAALWGITPVFAFGPGVSYVFQAPPSSAQGNVRNAALYLSLGLTSGLRFPLFGQFEGSVEVQSHWIFSQLVSGNTMLTVWTPSAGLHWKF